MLSRQCEQEKLCAFLLPRVRTFEVRWYMYDKKVRSSSVGSKRLVDVDYVVVELCCASDVIATTCHLCLVPLSNPQVSRHLNKKTRIANALNSFIKGWFEEIFTKTSC